MSAGEGRTGWIALIRILPRSTLSHLVGRLAAVPLPRWLRGPVWRGFARAVGADLAEVRDPLEEMPALQDFFTRALRDGARPVASERDAFVSPCDGAWGEAGRVESGRLLQVKGRDYSLAALFDDAELAQRFEGGAYATFYLAPRDYHRFHAPCDLLIERAVHVPGGLWPVNRIGLTGVPDLFARNERLCAHAVLGGERLGGEPDLVMVAVGATLVGRVRLAFDDLVTHQRGAARSERRYVSGVAMARGQEWGRFEFGSTIVLVAAPGLIDLSPRASGSPVRLGERIGALSPQADG